MRFLIDNQLNINYVLIRSLAPFLVCLDERPKGVKIIHLSMDRSVKTFVHDHYVRSITLTGIDPTVIITRIIMVACLSDQCMTVRPLEVGLIRRNITCISYAIVFYYSVAPLTG